MATLQRAPARCCPQEGLSSLMQASCHWAEMLFRSGLMVVACVPPTKSSFFEMVSMPIKPRHVPSGCKRPGTGAREVTIDRYLSLVGQDSLSRLLLGQPASAKAE